MFIYISNCQTLIQQVEDTYNVLDSISYIENIIESYKKAKEEERKEMDNTDLELFEGYYNKLDSVQREAMFGHSREYLLDSIRKRKIIDRKFWIQKKCKEFNNRVKAKVPTYILNLEAKNEKTLQADTGKLSFDLFYFSKNYKDGFYVYCSKGEYDWDDTYYTTFSKK